MNQVAFSYAPALGFLLAQGDDIIGKDERIKLEAINAPERTLTTREKASTP